MICNLILSLCMTLKTLSYWTLFSFLCNLLLFPFGVTWTLVLFLVCCGMISPLCLSLDLLANLSLCLSVFLRLLCVLWWQLSSDFYLLWLFSVGFVLWIFIQIRTTPSSQWCTEASKTVKNTSYPNVSLIRQLFWSYVHTVYITYVTFMDNWEYSSILLILP